VRKKQHTGGLVSVVGAGPGDPKLLTLRGKEALESCDVVVYDHLINTSVLEFAKDADRVYVGKKGGASGSTRQGAIQSTLVRLARQGKHVVRLKGGDPFVFGRGGEEALCLAKERIPFEVVPGITSGVAAPAYSGIPITHRGLASEVTFITAHEDPFKKKPQINWSAIARLSGTLVLYMGMKNLPKTVALLLKRGKKASTKVTAIRWGTTAAQRAVSGTLETIVNRIENARLSSPLLVVIGEVNVLRKKLSWFEEKPLFGKTVLVTRPKKQASKLGEALSECGANVVALPTIQIKPVKQVRALDRAIGNIKQFDWLVFTSENGVEMFFRRLKRLNQDARALSSVKIAVIGPGTRAKLERYSVQPDLVPTTYTTRGLLSAFERRTIKKKRFVLLRADIAPDFLRTELQTRGAHVTEVPVYQTQKPQHLSEDVQELVKNQSVDYITFTSASTAMNFYESFNGGERLRSKVISIGPVTSEAIRSSGGAISREAREATVKGLVRAILDEQDE
jgi:uroporphyrinogen III methyltransferase / synthase